MTPDLHTPQTSLVVQAVKKDQEGDATAALSLYCKALDFFVPALHCECLEPRVQQGWVSHSGCGGVPEATLSPEFYGRQGSG